MFEIASEMSDRLDALDALCKAYPKTDTKWRTESFRPYVNGCAEKIGGYKNILAEIRKEIIERGTLRGTAIADRSSDYERLDFNTYDGLPSPPYTVAFTHTVRRTRPKDCCHLAARWPQNRRNALAGCRSAGGGIGSAF